MYKYRTPFEAQTWKGASFANFDVNALITDLYYHPAQYLNGTAPLDVQGVGKVCDVEGNNCKISASLDSFAWYDPLHPSEQTSRVVAKEFVSVLGGKSKFASYWS